MFNFLKTTISTSKKFEYKKGDISLGFTLNVDKKDDLEGFLELLKAAQGDVTNEINKWQQ
jgi:hypothetical protein